MRPEDLPTLLPSDPLFEPDAEAAPGLGSGEHLRGNRAHPNHVGLDTNYPSIRLADNPAISTFAADAQDRTGASSADHTSLHFGKQGATLMGTKHVPLRSEAREFLVGTGFVILFGIDGLSINLRGRLPRQDEARETRCEKQDNR
jgi:hypothetical protein